MPPIDTLLSFVLATAMFACMPGPSMLYVATQTLVRGRHAGFNAAIGVHLGGYFHVVAASAGLSVLFTAVPTLYVVIKLFGAAYLVWLGVQFIRASKSAMENRPTDTRIDSPARALLDSAIVEVLNPKTAMFYIAFLPQFTDPSATLPMWGQLFLLGTFVNLAFSCADTVCVLLSSSVVSFLTGSEAQSKLVQRIGGVMLVGPGNQSRAESAIIIWHQSLTGTHR